MTKPQEYIECVWKKLKSQLILLLSLFLLLFINSTVLFGIIHESLYTISANFYFYLQYFQQKVFNFKNISVFQLDPECPRTHSTQDYKKIKPSPKYQNLGSYCKKKAWNLDLGLTYLSRKTLNKKHQGTMWETLTS